MLPSSIWLICFVWGEFVCYLLLVWYADGRSKSGFNREDEWGYRALEPMRCCISSIALVLLKTGIIHHPNAEKPVEVDYAQMTTAQKLLLFWRKPAVSDFRLLVIWSADACWQRKCWWDGIDVELPTVDSKPARTVKLWARRVWTLELSLVGNYMVFMGANGHDCIQVWHRVLRIFNTRTVGLRSAVYWYIGVKFTLASSYITWSFPAYASLACVSGQWFHSSDTEWAQRFPLCHLSLSRPWRNDQITCAKISANILSSLCPPFSLHAFLLLLAPFLFFWQLW